MRPLTLFSFVLLLAFGACTSVTTHPVFTTDARAIRGYDPVAYFTEGKAVPGNPAYRHIYEGATWYFASAEHRALFAENPARYALQYGGYCAQGMANGFVISTDPYASTVVDDKLYLNYSPAVLDMAERHQG